MMVRRRTLRLAGTSILFASVLLGATLGWAWLLLGGLALLGTAAFAPTANLFLAWPVGLVATIVAAYGAHMASWAISSTDMSRVKAQVVGVSVGAFFAAVSLARQVKSRTARSPDVRTINETFVSVLLAALPLLIVTWATVRLYSDPRWLVSAYIGGGDHAAHASVVQSVISPSAGLPLESPFSLYTYPRGIHNLLAVLNVIHAGESSATDIATLYSVGGWFEFVQLAAYASLSVLLLRRLGGRSGYRLTVLAPMVMFAFASAQFYMTHLFWSGFTTSLGITWILLVPLAVRPWSRGGEDSDGELQVSPWLLLLVVAASWIVYQPYVIASGIVLLSDLLVRRSRRGGGLGRLAEVGTSPWVVGATSVLAVVTMAVVPGRGSHLVDTFLLDGDLFRPSLVIAMFWVVSAFGGLTWIAERGAKNQSGAVKYLSGLTGTTVGFASLVSLVSGSGFFQLPYYVEKMIWVLLYVSFPVALGAALRLVSDSVSPSAARRRTVTAVVGLLAFPLVTGGTPANATRHSAPDWFVSVLMSQSPGELSGAVAYHPLDPLGSHLSNLALRLVDSTDLPSSISLESDTHAACRIINDAGVKTVVTVDYAVGSLLDSGCLPNRTYLAKDGPVSITEGEYFPMKVNHFYRFGESNLGRFLFLRGFREPESWGTWASGYMSAFGLKFPSDSDRVTLILGVRPSFFDSAPEKADVFIDFKRVDRVDLPQSGGELRIDLGPRSAGEKLELAFDCLWSIGQAREVEPSDGPPPCLGFEWIRILAEPASSFPRHG